MRKIDINEAHLAHCVHLLYCLEHYGMHLLPGGCGRAAAGAAGFGRRKGETPEGPRHPRAGTRALAS